MSVLIRGMEMPQDGEMLCINIYPDGKVCIDLDLKCKQIATAAPAADVAPVVRCGECENWQSGWKPSAAKDGMHFCAMVGLCTSADWFCADGERKDGDGYGV